MTSWSSFQAGLVAHPTLGFWLDVSRLDIPSEFYTSHRNAVQQAFAAMDSLEHGAIANPDEERMVGHYWLRDPSRAPTPALRNAVEQTLTSIERFVDDVHEGRIVSERGSRFSTLLVVGIGGSALGPQLVSSALTRGPALDRMRVFFFDNTDPDGMDRTLAAMGTDALQNTLVVVISKSGGTKETRNGMLEAENAWKAQGLNFARHAVAITGDGSELDRYAKKNNWITRFPMWDWVGGRTSETSAVGLLPAALQGLDIRGLLQGARSMDAITRVHDHTTNPAMQLALAWLFATRGRGEKDMVLLPYKDRLELFSRYLQQLVMESLGKEFDLQGQRVHQGIAVYGNKGSTDQHAYVQQLRDGVNNFFVTFIEVLVDREGSSIEVDPGITSGDYLFGFLQGTRRALYESGRGSITLTFERVDARTVGMLIALYERAVGFYASLVNINAYHQPGVEAGKKAAAAVITLQTQVLSALETGGNGATADEIATRLQSSDVETIWALLRRLAAQGNRGVIVVGEPQGTKTRYARAALES